MRVAAKAAENLAARLLQLLVVNICLQHLLQIHVALHHVKMLTQS